MNVPNDVDEPKDKKRNGRGKLLEVQCPRCEEWWSKRGYNSHNRFCEAPLETERQEEPTQTQQTNENEGPKTEENHAGEINELDIAPDKPECTTDDCENTDLHDAQEVAKLYREHGHEQQAKQIANHDLYCDECHTAQTKSEAYND